MLSMTRRRCGLSAGVGEVQVLAEVEVAEVKVHRGKGAAKAEKAFISCTISAV